MLGGALLPSAAGHRSLVLHSGGSGQRRTGKRPPPCSAALEQNTLEIPNPQHARRWVSRELAPTFRQASVIQKLQLPPLAQGEVLIRISFMGINGGCETFRARGEYAFARSPSSRGPVLMGAEGAGIVAAVGPFVTKFKVGAAVAVNGAGFSDWCVVRERQLILVPGTAGPEAAVLALSGMTACAALEGTAGIKAGDVVVVTAAAGGTGHIAVQLALLAGCRVVAVCGGPRKAAALWALAGEHAAQLVVVDHTKEDVGDVLKQQFGGGVDVVFEGVGGALQRTLLRALAPGGRLLQVGYISEYPHAMGYPDSQPPLSTASNGDSNNSSNNTPLNKSSSSHDRSSLSWPEAAADVPPTWQLFWEGINVELPEGRRLLGKVWPSDAATLMRCRKHVFDLHYKQGSLHVMADLSHKLHGLDAVPDAVEWMLEGKGIGKVVLPLD